MNKYKFQQGFTLAEVLITLGIIGVVSAMTISTLINNTKDSQYKTAYKKAYTTISQAFYAAKQNGDIIELTGTFSSQGVEVNFAAIQSQFKVIKSCTDSYTQKCWDNSGEKWRGDTTSAPGFIDISGAAWKLRDIDSSNLGHAILIDTNGLKGPNVYGKDRFPLFMNNSNGKDPWLNISSSTLGMPTKISPIADVPKGTTDAGEQTKCPSYQTLTCYFTTWLLGD